MGIWRSVERRRVVFGGVFSRRARAAAVFGAGGSRSNGGWRRGEVRDWLRGSVSARRDGRRRKLSSAGDGQGRCGSGRRS